MSCFQAEAKQMFSGGAGIRSDRNRCPSDCSSCSYIEEHFPGELKWLKKTAGSSAKSLSVKSVLESGKTPAPHLFRVGAYASKLKSLLGSNKTGKKAA